MTLFDGETGKTYIVENTDGLEAGIGRRLEALGLTGKTPLRLLNRKKNGAVIFTVRGTRLAVGRLIAEKIEVAEAGNI